MATQEQRRQEAAYWSNRLRDGKQLADQIQAACRLSHLGHEARVGVQYMISALESNSGALRQALAEGMWRLHCAGLDIIGPLHLIVSTSVVPRAAYVLEGLEYKIAKHDKKLSFCPF